MIKKILVPVDGSENSFRALDQALFVAKSTGAQATAIYVMESPPTVYVESQKVLNEIMAKYRQESARVLDKCKERAGVSGVEIETVLAEGDPASSIVEYAKNEGFDMIVMGSRGLGKIKELMLGSVSSKVLHHAKCSVLIVK